MPIESKEVKIKNERKEVFVDFDGTSKEAEANVLIQEDSYPGEIVSVDLISVPAYEQPKGAKETVMENKVVFHIKLSGEGSNDAVLSMYANPIIKKSSGTKGYSNSKLFDLLDMSGELDAAKASWEALETLKGLVGFLSAKLVGRKVKALVKTRNKGTENAYSGIGSFVRFEPKPAAEVA